MISGGASATTRKGEDRAAIMLRRPTLAGALVIGAFVTWNVAASVAADQQRGDPAVRSVLSGGPLLQHLRPEDSTLEVVPISSGPEPILPPEGMDYTEWWTRTSDFVAIIRVEDRKSRLTEDQTFLATDVQASVLEVLKDSPGRAPKLGSKFTFVESGGEFTVGRQRIIGKKIGGVPLETGVEYHVFGYFINGAVYLDSPWTYKIVDGRLIATSTTQPVDDITGTRDINELKQKIREKSVLPKPTPR